MARRIAGQRNLTINAKGKAVNVKGGAQRPGGRFFKMPGGLRRGRGGGAAAGGGGG